MIRVHLPDDEARSLELAFRSTTDRKLRDRLQIVLMAHRGRRPADIALDLRISTRTVPRWLNAYLEHGLDGLTPRKAKGATPRIPAALADAVRRWVIGGPAAQPLVGQLGVAVEDVDDLEALDGRAALPPGAASHPRAGGLVVAALGRSGGYLFGAQATAGRRERAETAVRLDRQRRRRPAAGDLPGGAAVRLRCPRPGTPPRRCLPSMPPRLLLSPSTYCMMSFRQYARRRDNQLLFPDPETLQALGLLGPDFSPSNNWSRLCKRNPHALGWFASTCAPAPKPLSAKPIHRLKSF
jgi:hypothetical protein